MLRLSLLIALHLLLICMVPWSPAGAAQDPVPSSPDAAPIQTGPTTVPPGTPAETLAPPEAAREPDAPRPPVPLAPPIRLGPDCFYAGAPDLQLSMPYTAGFPVGPGIFHPYAGARLEYRSNVFYKTARIDHDTLEALDVGLHWATPAAEAAGTSRQIVADYQARFELFNRFSELNYIQQHGFFSAQLRTPDLGAGLTDHLGTAHDPDTVELATLVNREVRRFYHHMELSAFQPRNEANLAGRFGIALTLDNARYEGTQLNFAETDAYGLNVSYTQPQQALGVLTDPLVFKFSMKGSDHPRPVLNNLVLYQALAKCGGSLGEAGNGAGNGPNGPEPWGFEIALGLAAIDVQTFRAGGLERRRDVLVPVAALQIDGELNARQVLRLRLTAVHEPDFSITSNWLRRTRLAARLTQHLNETYEWEVQAAEEWSDPSRGPTLTQFTFHGEVRWYKEFPRFYLGRHAPIFFRVETRNLGTAQRNTSGVKTWNDTRLTLGWAIVL